MTFSREENGTLSDALAGLLGHLKGHPYRLLSGERDEALHDEADRFAGKLADHLRYSEQTLFPALRNLEPGLACDIDGMEKDHRLLDLYARDLSIQIQGGDKRGACGVARSFLAVLLDHIRRETEGVDRFVHSLDVPDARRLSRALMGQSPLRESDEEPPRESGGTRFA